jgi:hypothetical protein
MKPLPPDADHHLRNASRLVRAEKRFDCQAFPSPEWNAFVNQWAPVVYDFLLHALGPFATEPLPTILPMHDGDHAAWATASFQPMTGQIHLSPVIEGRPGQTLEKLCHEMTHASLANFPEGDPFYEEGFVDYAVWVMSHAPIWGEHREAMFHAAEYNIAQRRERAEKTISDWDVKRWAGGTYAMLFKGPFIIAHLKMHKAEGNLTW